MSRPVTESRPVTAPMFDHAEPKGRPAFSPSRRRQRTERRLQYRREHHPGLVAQQEEPAARARHVDRRAGRRRRQPDHLPRPHRVTAHQADAVTRFAVAVVVVGQRPEPLPRRTDHRRREPVRGGVQRARRHRGLVQVPAAGLIPVALLQRQDVRVEGRHRGGQPYLVDQAVLQGPAMQQVERRQAHSCTLRCDVRQ
jgi:hypothetical protein